MNELHHAAIKRALEEYFGCVGIDDPEDLRLMLNSKMAEMNAIDRIAFDMRLGRIARELEGEGSPKTLYVVIAYAIFALAAWFIWHPLAVALAIIMAGNIRVFAIRYALFWTPLAAIFIGGMYGLFIAILVRAGIALTTHKVIAATALGILGFVAAGYIGYSIPATRNFLASGDERRVLAQKTAVACYLLAMGCFLAWHYL